MNYKTYMRKQLDTGEVERLPFEQGHFASAGIPSSYAFGMPELQAHRLVNKWNTAQETQRTMYALE